MTSITAGLGQALDATTSGIQNLSEIANLPVRNIEVGLVDVAKRLNFNDVIQQWYDAQSALGFDPADATTRASRLVETLCKHILHAKDMALPNDQSIQSLYRSASRALVLGPEQQSPEDLRLVGSGLISITSGIGALRTHAGIAHGTPPGARPINFSHARIAVNAAGVLATFLMDTLLAQEIARPLDAATA